MTEELEKKLKRLEKEEVHINKDLEKLDSRISIFNWLGWVAIFIGVVIGCFGISFYLGWNNPENQMKINELGDYLGGTVASLWALSGLFFIYVAFLGQQKQMLLQNLELKYNQVELSATRIELRGQKEQLIEQNETSRLQRFENTFFNLLTLFNQVVNDMNLEEGKMIPPLNSDPINHFIAGLNNHQRRSQNGQAVFINGRGSFKELYRRFLKIYERFAKKEENNTNELIKHAYSEFFKIHQTELRHYLKTLIQVLKFVDNSTIGEKQKYFDIIRAQLSAEETNLLFYHSYIGKSNFEYVDLVVKHEMLRGLSEEDLLDQSHFSLYQELINS